MKATGDGLQASGNPNPINRFSLLTPDANYYLP
jgi:hypothetical protein